MGKLAVFLERVVPNYTRPKKKLEQYRTPPEIAIKIAERLVYHYQCKSFIDLGTGTGMLLAATILLGAGYGIGVDIDLDAVKDAKRSPLYTSTGLIELVQADALSPPIRPSKSYCIVENPPFGISSRRKIDRQFLETAFSLQPRVVASIHSYNEKSLELFEKIAQKENYTVETVLRHYFPIPAVYETHAKRIHYTETMTIFFKRKENS